MTRLSNAFSKSHPALVAFITAGDGDTAANLDALVAGGADVIELGMPFTDPMADGPVIQEANIRSLNAGTTTADIFALASAFRKRHPDTPLVLMGYANPMTIRGGDWFASECNKAGVDGASGFLYYVSVAGITGLQVAAQTSIDEAVARLKAHTDLPIAVGFGVRTPEQAANIARVADGVVVGSAIVELVATHGVNAAGPVRDYVASLKSAIISARG
jgi:tryptophan synthase alpha chain